MQVGGSKRIAVAHRAKQILRIVLLLAGIAAYLAIGHDEIKTHALLFMLVRRPFLAICSERSQLILIRSIFFWHRQRRASEATKLFKSLRA